MCGYVSFSHRSTKITRRRRRILDSQSCVEDYTGKPCSGRETARCRGKIRYVSKCTAASRGPPCDSTALVIDDATQTAAAFVSE